MDHAVRNLAVFIDFENCAGAPAFDLQLLMSRLKERGRLVIKRAYGDWGRFSKQKKELAKASVSLIELPSHGGRGKNSADIALVVDALEATMNRPHIDTVVVVSGDSDYTPLYTKVRELGKHVIVVGPRNGTSDFVKDYCDELLFFSSLAGHVATDKSAAKESYSILLTALRAIADEGREARLSLVKTRMKQLDASFDESNYGFNKFSKYLVKAERDGVIEIIRHDASEWTVSDGDDNEPTEDDIDASNPAIGEQAHGAPTDPTALLLTHLRKRKVVVLEPVLQRKVVDRILRTASALSLPASKRTFNMHILEQFSAEIERGELSRTKVRGVLELLVKAGAFTQQRVEDEEDPYTEIELAISPDNSTLMHQLHDRFLLEEAESHGIDLDATARATMLINGRPTPMSNIAVNQTMMLD